jgi:tetratricopeptide (TPR) repeat protein
VRYLTLVEEVGAPEECAAVARRAVERMPAEPAGYAAAGRASLRRGHAQEALRWLEQALRLAPGRAELHALRGDALLATGDPGRRAAARQAYRRAVRLQPALGRALYRLGQSALAERDWEEAAQAFASARAVGTEPLASLRGLARAAEGAGQSLVAWARWAEFHEERGAVEAARRAYGRLLAHPETALEASLRLADLEARHQRLREAISRLEATVRRAPGSVAAWQLLARAYRSFGQIPEARAAWRRVAALDPSVAPDAHAALAGIAESLGEFDEAERQYGESLRLRPGDASTRRLLGTLLFARRRVGDRLPRAVAELERAVALEPGDADAFVSLGHAYEAAGRAEEALLALRHAVDLAPGSGAVYLDVGRLARRLGRREESEEMLALYRRFREAQRQLEGLRSTIAARPGDPAVRLTLADYYFCARDFARAASEYERALSLDAGALPPVARRAARARLALAYERLARREDATSQLALLGKTP